MLLLFVGLAQFIVHQVLHLYEIKLILRKEIGQLLKSILGLPVDFRKVHLLALLYFDLVHLSLEGHQLPPGFQLFLDIMLESHKRAVQVLSLHLGDFAPITPVLKYRIVCAFHFSEPRLVVIYVLLQGSYLCFQLSNHCLQLNDELIVLYDLLVFCLVCGGQFANLLF